SAVVTGRVRGADSVAVRYGVAGSALDSATPAVTLAVDSVLVPVLGLLPDTRYLLRFVAYAGDQTILGDTVGFATGTLPADLPRYVADGADPSPGYVVFATGLYGLVIDNGGRVVWYHRFFPYAPGLNFEAHATGRYVARPSVPDPTVLAHWIEIDPLANSMHCTSLYLHTDDQLYVSLRSLNIMNKNDTRAGAVLLRIGALDDEFVVQHATTPLFSFLHGVRLTTRAPILLRDNVADP